MEISIPDCIKCKNYFITHEPGRPYGCRAMAFKSRINPARLVYQTSGIDCQLFSQKTLSNIKMERKKKV